MSRGRLLLLLGAWLVLFYMDLPLLVVVPTSVSAAPYIQFPPAGLSPRWYGAFGADPSWTGAMDNSLLIAAGTALVATVVGTLAALGLQRVGRGRGQWLLAFLLCPLIVPHMNLAIGLYPVMARLQLVGTPLAVVLGHAVVATPLVVLIVVATLQRLDPALGRAAASLGANAWQRFRLITLPLILPGVLGGAAFAFAASFDELEIALFLSGATARTLPLQLWQQIQFELTPVVAVASVVTAAIFLGGLALIQGARWLATRRITVEGAGGG
ncbi:MAG TPA: ABC transporter permease [Candidatus Dormibacteraeota bacterium]|nr:ABC transporter permease [Candidatus Dormibacteraeota bacterium]